MARRRPNLLLIAATDTSGGSGLQADLRVCTAFDCHPLSVVTAVTSQTPSRLLSCQALPGETIAAQLAAIESLPVAAVKIGALPGEEAVRTVAEWLRGRPLPLVVDPVFAVSGGQALSGAGVPRALRRELLPQATLLTPNAEEFRVLTGVDADAGEAAVAAARDLVARGGAVLLKGGHRARPDCEDLLVTADSVRAFSHPRRPGRGARGTGCALATACAAGLARGLPLGRAVEEGIEHVQRALSRASALAEGVAVL